MHQRSFYVHPDDVGHDEVVFRTKEAHHIASVIRAKKGDRVLAVDGVGTCYSVELLSISPKQVKGRVLQITRGFGEPVTEVTLAAGIVKGSRYEWLIEKATEMGVKKIIPFTSETSVVTGSSIKLARWKRVSFAAMKQCLRSAAPEITDVVPLTRVLKGGAGSVRIIASNSKKSIGIDQLKNKITKTKQKVSVVVGPEGGFSDEEIHEAIEQGFTPVTLGTRRLRSETASIVMLSLVFNVFGDML
ncbi:16S rRNA (uracil(1498)-N(3))-methyltransferase [bacterium]|nr:16S rRNA (uracil(1498)-N(3))-methyltransferase [bacterium]